MATYYVDDGGSATAPYDTWAKAATSLSALDDAVAFAAGDIVYIGHDHVCQFAHAASRTITGPSSGVPLKIISATQGSSPPTYQAGTANQIDTSEGAYYLTFTGSFAIYGVRMKSGAGIQLNPAAATSILLDGCYFLPANNGAYCMAFTGSDAGLSGRVTVNGGTMDLAADGTTARGDAVFRSYACSAEVRGLSFSNAGYRTGVILTQIDNPTLVTFSGCDFSGFTNATDCEWLSCTGSYRAHFYNCKSKASPTFFTGTPDMSGRFEVYGCGSADAPTQVAIRDAFGDLASTTSIARSGGATPSGTSVAWLITTTASCAEGAPFFSPWIYGNIETTGSKTFDLYITNDTGDFTDAEVWLEVEYKGTSGQGLWARASDQRTITTTAAAQTDDVTSSWSGSGPAYTYKQKLSVSATVNQTGLYRARVCVGLASIASGRNFYVDPEVTVS